MKHGIEADKFRLTPPTRCNQNIEIKESFRNQVQRSLKRKF